MLAGVPDADGVVPGAGVAADAYDTMQLSQHQTQAN
jgi:hypothetical protein